MRKPRRSSTVDPFDPPDPELTVCDVTETHVCVLNKFNVVPRHLLLVTRAWERQDALLTEADFAALCACMREGDALAFHNGGRTAGASQPHKHLQITPVPLGEGPEHTPIDRAVAEGRLPYPHAVARWSDDPRVAHARYLELLDRIDRRHDGAAHNWLATRAWMLAVPRTREKWRDVSINSLGFAGSLLVKRDEQLSAVRDAGPVSILRSVTA